MIRRRFVSLLAFQRSLAWNFMLFWDLWLPGERSSVSVHFSRKRTAILSPASLIGRRIWPFGLHWSEYLFGCVVVIFSRLWILPKFIFLRFSFRIVLNVFFKRLVCSSLLSLSCNCWRGTWCFFWDLWLRREKSCVSEYFSPVTIWLFSQCTSLIFRRIWYSGGVYVLFDH